MVALREGGSCAHMEMEMARGSMRDPGIRRLKTNPPAQYAAQRLCPGLLYRLAYLMASRENRERREWEREAGLGALQSRLRNEVQGQNSGPFRYASGITQEYTLTVTVSLFTILRPFVPS